MSNKVQVIFTFELVNRERKEVQGGGGGRSSGYGDGQSGK